MSATTVKLPKSLHQGIRKLARRDGITVNQFLASAAAEKMSALMTVEYLRQEAALGRAADFENFLAAVPDREPEAGDRLPTGLKPR